MKKYFFSIISVLILAVLTSCSGLTDSYSQVSVEFPEGTSNQLTLLRAADNTSSNITCLLKTTGDYEATATANYSSAEELNNKQITISGIPVNKTIAVKTSVACRQSAALRRHLRKNHSSKRRQPCKHED